MCTDERVVYEFDIAPSWPVSESHNYLQLNLKHQLIKIKKVIETNQQLIKDPSLKLYFNLSSGQTTQPLDCKTEEFSIVPYSNKVLAF